MSPTDIVLFLAVVGAAAYVQAMTGFALAMVVLAGVTILELMPIETVTVAISFMGLLNAVIALGRDYSRVAWRPTLLMLLGCIPTIIIGVVLLQYLSDNHVNILRVLLAVVLVASGLIAIRKPDAEKQLSSGASFLFMGSLGGLMGGLFSASGPPLVFQFYRQPIAMDIVRDSLLFTFLFTSALRIGVVSWRGELSEEALTAVAISIPAVVIFSWVGKKYPLPLNEELLKKSVFVLLLISAVGIILPAFA